jgi:anhydro-N-acetylmuramic acid kinase
MGDSVYANTDNFVLALGLMSGTSLDGVDAALIKTDGSSVVETLAAVTIPYSDELRASLRDLIRRAEWMPDVDPVTEVMTRAHAEAVEKLLRDSGVPAEALSVIGFHGQTILHRPEAGLTWQIGDGALLAELTGVNVVSDFRSADMAAGGEGAPLAPIYHAALASKLDKPVAILNIGGVSNVTWIGPDIGSGVGVSGLGVDMSGGVGGNGGEGLLAFDTGPGNAMIDDWVLANTGKPMDENGALAAAGRVDAAIVATMLENTYFDRKPPKSLDRNAFDAGVISNLTLVDGAATLTTFTVASIGLAADHFPSPVSHWYVCGGGRKNQTLMSSLAQRLQTPVASVEALGWDGDSLEAQAFGYLAVRRLRSAPISFPMTTGAPGPLVGGQLDPA